MKRAKKALTVLLALSMLMSLLSLSALAAAEPSYDVSGSKEAEIVSGSEYLSKDDTKAKVTLSLPSAEYKNKVDVVFVMDGSTSTHYVSNQFADIVNVMLRELDQKNADVRVGVIKFKGQAFDMIKMLSGGTESGLLEYSEGTAADLIQKAVAADEKTYLKPLASGTNAHAGLRMAEDMLARDTDVDADSKYVIFLTDGKTYIWNDADDVATTIYTQRVKAGKGIDVGGKVDINQWAGAYDKSIPAYNPIYDRAPTFWFDDYAKLYASDSKDFEDGFEYDYRCAYAYNEGDPTGTVNVIETTNGNTLFHGKADGYKRIYEFVPNGDFEDLKFLEVNPYNYTYQVEDDTKIYSFDEDSLNPAYYMSHADCLQKGLYKAGHLWTDMSDVYGYHTAAIMYDGWGKNSGASVAYSFCDWVVKNSEYGADIENTDDVNGVFNSIKENILYLIEKGTVTDKIPADYVLVPNSFTMTYDGKAIACAADGENKWNFGTAGEDTGVFPYVVEYHPATETDNAYFTWTLNVPVENAHPVTLSYLLDITKEVTDPQTGETAARPNGDYDTNVSAILNYVSTEGERGEFEFDIPALPYMNPYTVTFHSNGGTEVEGNPQTVMPGDKAEKPADPTYSGYNFGGWYIDEDLTEAYDFAEPVHKDIDLYAKWSAIPVDDDDDDPTPPVIVTPPEEPETPETPETPEDPENISEEDVPLSNLPAGEPDELEELEEEEVPLAAVPKTSDFALLWLASSALSGIGLGALNLKKREDEDEQ